MSPLLWDDDDQPSTADGYDWLRGTLLCFAVGVLVLYLYVS